VLADPPLDAAGIEEARRDAVDAHAFLEQALGQRLGQAGDPGAHHVRDDVVRLRLLCTGRTDEDYGATALAQGRYRLAYEADGAHRHELEGQMPLLVGEGVERAVGHVAAVDDEDIEASESGERVIS
jgi:hypothetical protein